MNLSRLGPLRSPVEQFVNPPDDHEYYPDPPVNHFIRTAASYTNMDHRQQKIAIGILSAVAVSSVILGTVAVRSSAVQCGFVGFYVLHYYQHIS